MYMYKHTAWKNGWNLGFFQLNYSLIIAYHINVRCVIVEVG
jgi:hypothetical protein